MRRIDRLSMCSKGVNMMESSQTVTLRFPSSRLPAMITRLTTYLLDKQYGFLQTCGAVAHTDFDIFNPQDLPIVRLTFEAADDAEASPETPASPVSRDLTPAAVDLLHHLLQTED